MLLLQCKKMLRMRTTENCVFFVFICWGCLSLLRCENVTHAHNGKLCVFCFYVLGLPYHYYGAKMLRMRITENYVFFVFMCWVCLSLLRCENVTHAHNGKLCVFCFYVMRLYVVIMVNRVTLQGH